MSTYCFTFQIVRVLIYVPCPLFENLHAKQPGPGDPPAGRGHLGARHGLREARAGSPQRAGGHETEDYHRHRTSPFNDPVSPVL